MVTKNTRYLKNKRVLITAGPTWVPIDSVRVISNIATGETGILLAEKLQKLGARVTLLLGPVVACCLNKKIKVVRFKFFDELKNSLTRELKTKRYDIIIHSAAVADYKPNKIYAHKINSGRKNLTLNLVPTEKIIDAIKKINKSIFLVGFKFELGASRKTLIKKAKSLINRAKLDLAVANTLINNRYRAYIIGKNNVRGPFLNKRNLIDNLSKKLLVTSY